MGTEVTVYVDDSEIRSRKGMSIIEAADEVGIYIPRLCYYPGIKPGPGTKAEEQIHRHGLIDTDKNEGKKTFGGCNICVVEIEGKGIWPSCSTGVEDGMIIYTDTTSVKELRRENLARICALHPHACIICTEKEGCDRDGCTQGVQLQSRCCARFDDCEFRKACEYITLKKEISRYIPRDISVIQTPFFTFDPNLCIGCTRCVRACEKTQGKPVIGFIYHHGEILRGTIGPSYKESKCVFCGACVAVCPTGALMETGLPWKKKAQLDLAPAVYPPEPYSALTEENIAQIPQSAGVYQMLDEKHNVLYICGTDDMQMKLREQLDSIQKARYFRYEEHSMYTMRETEILEKYFKKHGSLPEVNDEIADLY